MHTKLDALLKKIKRREGALAVGTPVKQHPFHDPIRARKGRVREGVLAGHKPCLKTLPGTLGEAKPGSIITGPVILSCLLPVLLLDVWASLYQSICFPAYGIPKVRRREYVVMDRRKLAYLNPIKKFSCFYCEYVNGLLAYVQEIAGRTEQYWCPIKHAVRLKSSHSRYRYFLEYGNPEQYRNQFPEARAAFDDLKMGE